MATMQQLVAEMMFLEKQQGKGDSKFSDLSEEMKRKFLDKSASVLLIVDKLGFKLVPIGKELDAKEIASREFHLEERLTKIITDFVKDMKHPKNPDQFKHIAGYFPSRELAMRILNANK